MTTALRPVGAVLGFVLALSAASPAPAAGFVDVLDAPALMTPLATRALLQAVTHAGKRLVAVGQRGDIVVSDDAGATWKQSPVPVSSDLTAVYFPDATHGWAVGHDGLVLHTDDAGGTWTLQLDGRKAAALQLAAMERDAAADPASDEVKRLLAEARRDGEQGPDKPFLDVWFADASNGYIVGAYNLIFHTVDGGKTWESWFDRTDNPKFFNLYAIRPVGGDLYIAGEGGLVLKLDAAAQRFAAVHVPYNGSFFGVTSAGTAVLVYGLRGNVFRSDDQGATWLKVDAGLRGAIVASTTARGGASLLADGGGRVVATTDGGRTFAAEVLKRSAPTCGLADLGDGRLALVGPRGVLVTALEQAR
jgi:photosystem II stability/assembly factor-like uncharacterized protein